MTKSQVTELLTKHGLHPAYGPDEFMSKWRWIPEFMLGGALLAAVQECKQIINKSTTAGE